MNHQTLRVPWEPCSEGWRLGQSPNWVAFDASGLHVEGQSGGTQDVPWRDVRSLTLSFGRHSSARDLWELISPAPTPDLAFSGTVAVKAELPRRDLDLTVPMTGPCSWQVAFVVEDLIQTLERERLHLIGQPGLVDSVVNEVAPELKPRARLLVNADLLGVDRLIGGHGAYRDAIEAVVARYR